MIYFESRGAEVVFDIYKDLGHDVDPNSPTMKKWFTELREKLQNDSK